jgi:hypothetical protein
VDNTNPYPLPNSLQVEHVGTIALGIGIKECVDIAYASCVTKLSKHLDIKHKYLQQQV